MDKYVLKFGKYYVSSAIIEFAGIPSTTEKIEDAHVFEKMGDVFEFENKVSVTLRLIKLPKL